MSPWIDIEGKNCEEFYLCMGMSHKRGEHKWNNQSIEIAIISFRTFIYVSMAIQRYFGHLCCGKHKLQNSFCVKAYLGCYQEKMLYFHSTARIKWQYQ